MGEIGNYLKEVEMLDDVDDDDDVVLDLMMKNVSLVVECRRVENFVSL